MSVAAGRVEGMTLHFSRAERAEMLRSHAGIVTALVANDEEARRAQLRAIVLEHLEKAAGEPTELASRMAKQVEAGAHVTHAVLRLLSKRLNLSEEETHQVIAHAISQLEDEALPE